MFTECETSLMRCVNCGSCFKCWGCSADWQLVHTSAQTLGTQNMRRGLSSAPSNISYVSLLWTLLCLYLDIGRKRAGRILFLCTRSGHVTFSPQCGSPFRYASCRLIRLCCVGNSRVRASFLSTRFPVCRRTDGR